jgi:hypothetical protein
MTSPTQNSWRLFNDDVTTTTFIYDIWIRSEDMDITAEGAVVTYFRIISRQWEKPLKPYIESLWPIRLKLEPSSSRIKARCVSTSATDRRGGLIITAASYSGGSGFEIGPEAGHLTRDLVLFSVAPI